MESFFGLALSKALSPPPAVLGFGIGLPAGLSVREESADSFEVEGAEALLESDVDARPEEMDSVLGGGACIGFPEGVFGVSGIEAAMGVIELSLPESLSIPGSLGLRAASAGTPEEGSGLAEATTPLSAAQAFASGESSGTSTIFL